MITIRVTKSLALLVVLISLLATPAAYGYDVPHQDSVAARQVLDIIFADDFSTDQPWIDESNDAIYRDVAKEWLYWDVSASETRRYSMPVNAAADVLSLSYRVRVMGSSAAGSVYLGLVEDLAAVEAEPGLPSGLLVGMRYDGTTGLGEVFPTIVYPDGTIDGVLPEGDIRAEFDSDSYLPLGEMNAWWRVDLVLRDGLWSLSVYDDLGMQLGFIRGELRDQHAQYPYLTLFQVDSGGPDWINGTLDDLILEGTQYAPVVYETAPAADMAPAEEPEPAAEPEAEPEESPPPQAEIMADGSQVVRTVFGADVEAYYKRMVWWIGQDEEPIVGVDAADLIAITPADVLDGKVRRFFYEGTARDLPAGTYQVWIAGLVDGDTYLPASNVITFDYAGPVVEEPEAPPAAAPPAEPCVATAPRQYVEVRLGPGENRGVWTSLPTGRKFTVLGQGEANDGSRWWKLDLSPDREAWVAQRDVDTSGGCDQVEMVAAPGIVFGAPAPPPSQPSAPADSGAPSGAASGDTGAPPASSSSGGPAAPAGCGVAVMPAFSAAYGSVQAQLGCPTDAGTTLSMVGQPFEHGQMYWSSVRVIYVLIYGGSFWQTADNWTDGMPASDPSINPPGNLLQPVRGFGYVWRSNNNVRSALGWATGGEFAFGSSWQNFANGAMFVGMNNQVFALLPGAGRYLGPF